MQCNSLCNSQCNARTRRERHINRTRTATQLDPWNAMHANRNRCNGCTATDGQPKDPLQCNIEARQASLQERSKRVPPFSGTSLGSPPIPPGNDHDFKGHIRGRTPLSLQCTGTRRCRRKGLPQTRTRTTQLRMDSGATCASFDSGMTVGDTCRRPPQACGASR